MATIIDVVVEEDGRLRLLTPLPLTIGSELRLRVVGNDTSNNNQNALTVQHTAQELARLAESAIAAWLRASLVGVTASELIEQERQEGL